MWWYCACPDRRSRQSWTNGNHVVAAYNRCVFYGSLTVGRVDRDRRLENEVHVGIVPRESAEIDITGLEPYPYGIADSAVEHVEWLLTHTVYSPPIRT